MGFLLKLGDARFRLRADNEWAVVRPSALDAIGSYQHTVLVVFESNVRIHSVPLL